MTEKVLSEKQEELCRTSRWDFSDLKALFINCTLKKSPELSHTEGLIRVSKAIMEKNNVAVEVIRAVDYDIANGVYADMTEFMTWNLLHLARMLRDKGGIPAHGNQRTKWAAGCRFDHPNPEYR